ncbi:MAG TPA: c-type cytochrome, partial [Polyangiales bacterium]|nr:c-type cytochrome [Polyangiales bacterium]
LRPLGAESLLLSQVARDGEIELGTGVLMPDPSTNVPPVTISPYSGGGGGGGGNMLGSCGGVVQSLLSRVAADGAVVQSRRIPGVLLVDVAHSPVSGLIAVAQAGTFDLQNPVTVPGFGLALASSVLVFSDVFAAEPDGLDDVPCAPANEALDIRGQVTAVAITSHDSVLAQSREPAFLAIADRNSAEVERIALDGASLADTGHALFHRNAGGGVACASCHAEGGDDGHTWRFSEMGLRRTQSLHVGLAGSAPFHWAGDERDFAALVGDVMVGRMGGARQTPERIAALEHWIYALQAPPAARPLADEAAQRGKLLFEGEAQCNTCHGGSALSSNELRAVGKGEALQVPSLVGVAYRRPLMHDGCASDLRARFETDCGGGDSHGKTSQLNESQLGDLIAYLETL